MNSNRNLSQTRPHQASALFVPIKDGAGAVFGHELVCIASAGQRHQPGEADPWASTARDISHLHAIAAARGAGLAGRIVVSLSAMGITWGAERVTETLRTLSGDIGSVLIQAPWEATAEQDTHATLQFATWCKSNGIGIVCNGRGDRQLQQAVWSAVEPTVIRIHAELLGLMASEGLALESIKRPGSLLWVAGVDAETSARVAEQHGADLFQGLVVGRPKRISLPSTSRTPQTATARAAGVYAMAAAGALALAACSSPPKPLMPDGSNRVEVNDPARVAAYQRYSMNETQRLAEQRALQEETTALRRQVDQLQSLMKIMIALPQKQEGTATPPAPSAAPQVIKPAAPAAPAATREQVGRAPVGGTLVRDYAREETPNGEIFRVFHNVGASTFAPDEVTSQRLVAAARAGSSIEIHGRTDSAVIDEANQRVALARAVSARAWLVERGVSPSKIRTRYQSAGSFLADNSNDEGRALNRRVEIAIFRPATAVGAAQGVNS